MKTLIRRCIGDAAAGLGLHFLHVSEGPFLHDAGHISANILDVNNDFLQFFREKTQKKYY